MRDRNSDSETGVPRGGGGSRRGGGRREREGGGGRGGGGGGRAERKGKKEGEGGGRGERGRGEGEGEGGGGGGERGGGVGGLGGLAGRPCSGLRLPCFPRRQPFKSTAGWRVARQSGRTWPVTTGVLKRLTRPRRIIRERATLYGDGRDALAALQASSHRPGWNQVGQEPFFVTDPTQISGNSPPFHSVPGRPVRDDRSVPGLSARNAGIRLACAGKERVLVLAIATAKPF